MLLLNMIYIHLQKLLNYIMIMCANFFEIKIKCNTKLFLRDFILVFKCDH